MLTEWLQSRYKGDLLMINKRSKNVNFVGLQGWMVNELNLKNNNLIVYAIIYGFSKNQDGEGFFSGSREYLASWTSSSVRGIQKNLNQLVEDGLIIKGTFNGKTVYKPNESILNLDLWTSQEYINGEQSSLYTEQMNNVPIWSEPNSFKGEQSSFSRGEQSSHNNIDIYNSNDNIDYTIDIYKDDFLTKVTDIVDYLNAKADTKFKSSSKKTKSLIHARFEDGFTVDDFYTVIDKKCEEWLYTDMAKYLRPETLFGTKFEGYLNQKNKQSKKEGSLFERIAKGEVTINYESTGDSDNTDDVTSELSLPF